VPKSVDLVDQNALNLTNEHLQIQKFFRRLYPGPPLTGEGKREGRKKGREEKGKGWEGDEGYRTGRREGWDKEEGEGEGEGRREAHPPSSPTPPV
jgi:hypothetical protein